LREANTLREAIVGASRNNYAARLGDPFKPSGNIHAVAKNVIVFDDDVADINSDAKFKTLIRPYGDIALRYTALNAVAGV
jgi:hypothetical protein